MLAHLKTQCRNKKPSCGKSHSCPPSDTQTPIWIWSKNLANFICLPWMNNTKFHHMAEKHISGVKRDVFFGISCACLLKHSRNSTFINVFYLQSLPKRGHVSDCWRTTFSGPVSFQLRERVPSISPRLDLAGEQETYHKFKLQIKWSFTACACNIFQSRLFIEAMTFRAKLCEEYKQETIKLFGT